MADWSQLERLMHTLEERHSRPVLPGELGLATLDDDSGLEASGPEAMEAARRSLDRQLASDPAAGAGDAAGGEQPGTSGRQEDAPLGGLAALWATVEARLGLSKRAKGLILLVSAAAGSPRLLRWHWHLSCWHCP